MTATDPAHDIPDQTRSYHQAEILLGDLVAQQSFTMAFSDAFLCNGMCDGLGDVARCPYEGTVCGQDQRPRFRECAICGKRAGVQATTTQSVREAGGAVDRAVIRKTRLF